MTQNNQVFERLVRELDAVERQALLRSISATIGVEPEPLFIAEESTGVNLEQTYQSLAWWERLFVWVAQVFRGMERDDVLVERLLRGLERDIERMASGTVDARRRLLLEPFAKHVEALDGAARELRRIVMPIMDGRRTEYVVFLGAILMPNEHHELLRQTDPEMLANIPSGTSERELKQRLTRNLEAALDTVPDGVRRNMRNALHFVDQLAAFANVNLRVMLNAFDAVNDERTCAFDYQIGHVERLSQVIAGLDQMPDLMAVEALALLRAELDRRERAIGTVSADPSGAVRVEDVEVDAFGASSAPAPTARIRNEEPAELVTADALATVGVFNAIREFSRAVPLESLLRLMKKDLWYTLKPSRGGEDWLSLYRRYFNTRLDMLTTRFQLNARLAEADQRLYETIGQRSDQPSADAYSRVASMIRRRHSAAVIRSASRRFWPEMMQLLKQILVYGEFYKAGNRAQFNDSFNDLQAIPAAVAAWSRLFNPDGQVAATLAAVGIAEAAAVADREFDPILTTVRTSGELMINLLGGILYARAGSTYDTLANFGELGGRRNAELVEELKQLHRNLEQFMEVLATVMDIEKRAAELKVSVALR